MYILIYKILLINLLKLNMNLKKGQELEVQIESLNIKGQGIGFLELDGQKYNIAVNRSYPGDKVLVSLRKSKKNF